METTSLADYVEQIMEGLLTQVPLSTVVAVVVAIIGVIAIPIFVWKFGRKGFAAIKAALQGKNAGV